MFRRDRFRALRQQRGFTHEEMAERLAVHARQINRYESGSSHPHTDVVARMAEVLNVSTDYLLGIVDDPTPYIRIDNLTPQEKNVLSAMRRGDVVAAVKALVG